MSPIHMLVPDVCPRVYCQKDIRTISFSVFSLRQFFSVNTWCNTPQVICVTKESGVGSID